MMRHLVVTRLCGMTAAIAAGLVVSACSTTGSPSGKETFDLGLPSHIGSAAAEANHPTTVAVSPLSSSEWLDSNGMVYRLAYVDAQQPKRYANSQWAGVPAELLTRRLRAHFAEVANVVAEGDTVGAPVIKVELEEFDQVFDSAQQSHSVIKLRATLVKTGRLIGQRTFFVEETCATPDAAGGAHALASLSESALDQLVQWSMPLLK